MKKIEPVRLGDVIKSARQRSNLTIEELASRVDITVRYLYRIENEGKKPSYDVLYNLIRELGIDPNLIFYPERSNTDQEVEDLLRRLYKCDKRSIEVIKACAAALINTTPKSTEMIANNNFKTDQEDKAMDYTTKKLLILGGAFQHSKLVAEAKKLGIYTIVTDNLAPEDSPAKQIADEYWMLNIYDVDEIVERCKKEGVDGVASAWLDPCQRPYTEICEKLGLPAYCDPRQVIKMTDKIAFKAMCREYNVDIIPDYSLTDVANKTVEFPVFVKPVDSRGSRGQTICYSYDELGEAIKFAQAESSDGGVLIEKYMEKVNEFHVTYFFVDGEPYLVRGSDNYCGPKELGMNKVVSCAIYPSRFLEKYIAGPHKNVVNMFKKLGIKNGPIFMQGFRDGDKFRFFDPGLRFPGVDCELVIKQATGINYMKAIIDIALSGRCEVPNASECYKLGGKISTVLYLNVRPGRIVDIRNEDCIKNNPAVIAYLPRCKVGDTISWSYNVNQRFAELDILTNTFEELVEVMDTIQKNIFVEDENGENMIFNLFDLNRIER